MLTSTSSVLNQSIVEVFHMCIRARVTNIVVPLQREGEKDTWNVTAWWNPNSAVAQLPKSLDYSDENQWRSTIYVFWVLLWVIAPSWAPRTQKQRKAPFCVHRRHLIDPSPLCLTLLSLKAGVTMLWHWDPVQQFHKVPFKSDWNNTSAYSEIHGNVKFAVLFSWIKYSIITSCWVTR